MEEDEKELNNYKKIGELDDLQALQELMEMTKRYVKSQDGLISECAKTLAE